MKRHLHDLKVSPFIKTENQLLWLFLEGETGLVGFLPKHPHRTPHPAFAFHLFSLGIVKDYLSVALEVD